MEMLTRKCGSSKEQLKDQCELQAANTSGTFGQEETKRNVSIWQDFVHVVAALRKLIVWWRAHLDLSTIPAELLTV